MVSDGHPVTEAPGPGGDSTSVLIRTFWLGCQGPLRSRPLQKTFSTLDLAHLGPLGGPTVGGVGAHGEQTSQQRQPKGVGVSLRRLLCKTITCALRGPHASSHVHVHPLFPPQISRVNCTARLWGRSPRCCWPTGSWMARPVGPTRQTSACTAGAR